MNRPGNEAKSHSDMAILSMIVFRQGDIEQPVGESLICVGAASRQTCAAVVGPWLFTIFVRGGEVSRLGKPRVSQCR